MIYLILAHAKLKGMIQRIQTVWWAASVIALAILPSFSLLKFEHGFLSFSETFSVSDSKILIVFLSIMIALSLLNILLFKKRLVQIKIGYMLLLLHLSFFLPLYLQYSIQLDEGDKVTILPAIVIPVISLIFQILAIRAVKKDEALIKSMDRLR